MNKLIIGNWKMNGNIGLVDEFLERLDNNVIVGLPIIFIAYANSKNPNLQIAAQDCSIFDDFGAHTGEISAKMLSESGCKYAIIGHSERRRTFDSDSVNNIFKKLQNTIENGMTAILCVDEKYDELLDSQTVELLKNHKSKIVLAYEPLSAIGTGIVPSISEISGVLKNLKLKYFGIRTIYGGSVNSKNAKEILEIDSVDGVLIGGASLKLDEINAIAKF